MEEEYKLKCFWDTRLNGIPHEGYSAQIEEQKNDLIEECKKINGTKKRLKMTIILLQSKIK